MNFNDFLDRLPACPGKDTLPIPNNPEGFNYIEKEIPEFVGPDLIPSEEVPQPDNPKIIIVSAAGAVGKSTLAKKISNEKSAPIWDLAMAPAVGGNSLTGQLISSFGFDKVTEVNKLLSNGDLFLVIDALDEARVKANEAGFEAFVQNLASLSKNTAGTTLVILGRTQTAITSWLLLEDAGVSASLFSIQPFTQEQAENYIELRIKNFDKSAATRIAEHKQPFIEARDSILNHLKKAVGNNDSNLPEDAAREFLGYAPVLETVSVLLAKEQNYKEFTMR